MQNCPTFAPRNTTFAPLLHHLCTTPAPLKCNIFRRKRPFEAFSPNPRNPWIWGALQSRERSEIHIYFLGAVVVVGKMVISQLHSEVEIGEIVISKIHFGVEIGKLVISQLHSGVEIGKRTCSLSQWENVRQNLQCTSCLVTTATKEVSENMYMERV